MRVFSRYIRSRKIRSKVSETYRDLMSFCEQNGVKPLTQTNLSSYKSSSVLCVLASGTSINEITQDQWQFINSHDSVSLNNTILHKHVPTYLFYETDARMERHEELNKLKFRNLVARKNDLNSTAIIWHYQEKRYFEIETIKNNGFDKNSYFQGSYALPGDTLEKFDESLKICLQGKLTDSATVGLYRRGSLARIIHFALAMGYKRVIFFGADLNGPDYFFDSYEEQDFPKGCIPPVLQNYVYNSSEGAKKQDSIHMTIDPSVHPVTMIDVIEHMNNEWCRSAGVKLEVFNKGSALYSVLDLAHL